MRFKKLMKMETFFLLMRICIKNIEYDVKYWMGFAILNEFIHFYVLKKLFLKIRKNLIFVCCKMFEKLVIRQSTHKLCLI